MWRGANVPAVTSRADTMLYFLQGDSPRMNALSFFYSILSKDSLTTSSFLSPPSSLGGLLYFWQNGLGQSNVLTEQNPASLWIPFCHPQTPLGPSILWVPSRGSREGGKAVLKAPRREPEFHLQLLAALGSLGGPHMLKGPCAF